MVVDLREEPAAEFANKLNRALEAVIIARGEMVNFNTLAEHRTAEQKYWDAVAVILSMVKIRNVDCE